jgi:hypothetical protein
MDRIKTLLKNKIVIRSAIVVGVAAVGSQLPAEQIDQLTNVISMIASLFVS